MRPNVAEAPLLIGINKLFENIQTGLKGWHLPGPNPGGNMLVRPQYPSKRLHHELCPLSEKKLFTSPLPFFWVTISE